MAVYHMNVKVGNKETASASAKLDYIFRVGKYINAYIYDEELERYAKERRDSPVYAKSGNMPSWADDNPFIYWSAADKHERTNGRLYVQIEVALPIELDLDQQVRLVRSFARQLTDKNKLPFTYAIHGDSKNPHCHLIISERGNDGIERSPDTWFRLPNAKTDPGARKFPILKKTEELLAARELWADMANAVLKAAGREERIDHRSHEARGLEYEPMIHEGFGPDRKERRKRNDEIMARNRRIKELEEIEADMQRLQAALHQGLSYERLQGIAAELAEAERKLTEYRNLPEASVEIKGLPMGEQLLGDIFSLPEELFPDVIEDEVPIRVVAATEAEFSAEELKILKELEARLHEAEITPPITLTTSATTPEPTIPAASPKTWTPVNNQLATPSMTKKEARNELELVAQELEAANLERLNKKHKTEQAEQETRIDQARVALEAIKADPPKKGWFESRKKYEARFRAWEARGGELGKAIRAVGGAENVLKYYKEEAIKELKASKDHFWSEAQKARPDLVKVIKDAQDAEQGYVRPTVEAIAAFRAAIIADRQRIAAAMEDSTHPLQIAAVIRAEPSWTPEPVQAVEDPAPTSLPISPSRLDPQHDDQADEVSDDWTPER